MNSKIKRLIFIPLMLASIMLVATFLYHKPSLVRAELPPRPTTVPTPASTSGTYIQLIVGDAIGNEWTTVQWQHPNTGIWHEVDGWQGTLDENMSQTWWLGSEHFGSGLFRWRVYDEEQGNLLITSDSFSMPKSSTQRLQMTVTVLDVE